MIRKKSDTFSISLIATLILFSVSGNISKVVGQTWTSVDGGGSNGINTSTATNSRIPSTAQFNGLLYSIWEEQNSGVDEVHIKSYNGSSWTSAGIAGSKLNSSPTNASNPKIACYNGALYAAYQEYDAGNYRIHVKKYDGSSWSLVENYSAGDGRTTINYGITDNAQEVDLMVYNGYLYATWAEVANAGQFNIRASRFDGTLWTSVDGGGMYGLNYNTSKFAGNPRFAVHNNQLYLTWEEVADANFVKQVRVRRYDGASVWTFVDGNASAGLNYDSSKHALTPVMVSYHNYLYLIWSEPYEETHYDYGDINIIRVRKYDGTSWSFVDGGGISTGWNLNILDPANNAECLVYHNLLFVTWNEADDVNLLGQVRCVQYDGTTKTFVDGNGAKGINQNVERDAQSPTLIDYNGDLYAAWSEEKDDPGSYIYQIRAKKYALPPFVESVSVPANETYKTSANLDFTVNCSKIVTVAGGTPYIPITLNTGGTVNANYTSGTGTSNLTFNYTIVAGNGDPDGISVGTAISNGGATLQSEDATPLAADLTLNNVGSTTGVLVDAIAPAVSSINRQTPATTLTNATSLVYRVTFSETVTGVGTDDFSMTATGTATGTIGSVTSSAGTVIDVTVNSISGSGTLRLDLNASGTGITDNAGNAIGGGFTVGETYTIIQVPTATTGAASRITKTGATLNCMINANNASTTVTFEYGTTTDYGTTVTILYSPFTGTTTTSESYTLSGLTPSTTYHYRVVGVNAVGTTQGNDDSFSTLLEFGSGTETDPFQIATLSDLQWLSQNPDHWDKYYIQTADIDASTTSGWNGGAGFSPIGNNSRKFSGSYNGQNHTISGLTISRSYSDYQGLFGHIFYRSTIQNLGVINANIIGSSNVGSLAGYLGGSVVTNCNSSGTVNGINQVGGLIGTSSWGGATTTNVSNSYSNCTVTGAGDYIGGLVGHVRSSSPMQNCFSTGNVSGTNYVGGLAGRILSEIENCYSTGDASGTDYVGGLVGYSYSTVNKCFCTGPVSGTSYVSGLIGDDYGTTTHSFWDTGTSGISTTGSGTGKTTAQMQDAGTYIAEGWDFTAAGGVWAMNGSNNSGYPWLRLEGYTPSDIWLGTTSPVWGTTTNWSEGSVPTSIIHVIIPDVVNDPVISATTAASCNNLNVTGTLTIESSAAGSGSLIVSGTPTGNVIYNRYLTGGATWHLISAPVSGQSIQTFAQAAGNSIATNSDKYGVGPYTENTNTWNLYTTGNIGTAGNFTPGKGYEALRTADGTVTFTGVPVTSGSATLERTAASNSGWNLVGNPFTSYIQGNTNTGDANNFLTVNSGSLRADFIGLYYWTGAAYETINQSSDAHYIAPGQGFFVRALDNSGKTVSFTGAMRTHTAGTFKSTSVSWPEIELLATASGKSGKTIIRFIPDMTVGLDPGYDAGAFEQEPDFGISTRLVEDNGTNFAIQCLPDNPDNLIVPVGLESKTTSGEITFSFRISGIDPQNIQFEDHQAGVLRTIDSSNGSYTATIEAGEPVYGRFFLRIGQTSSTAITELQPVKAWYSENKIIIEGITEPNTRAELYDIQGRQITSTLLNSHNNHNNHNNYNNYNTYNSLPLPASLSPGLYLLRIQSGGKVQTLKVAMAD